MCTLTVLRAPWLDAGLPADLRWRMVFNRDELRTRKPAHPPVAREYGRVTAVHPIDADGGGTWIAASSGGLVFAMLNGDEDDRHPAPAPPGETGRPAPGPWESRGLIIPRLLATPARSVADVAVDTLDPRRYRPFRLVIADDREVLEVASDGARLGQRSRTRGAGVVLTSSSADTARVCAWRIRLFADLVPGSSPAAQDAFHRHRTGDARGIDMTREDACTVSITTIDARADGFLVTYEPTAVPGPTVAARVARAAVREGPRRVRRGTR